MSLSKKLFIGSSAAGACPTDSVQPFGVDSAYSSNIALYQLNSDGGTTNNVPDTVGNYNGTASNVTYSTGQFGNAAVFNGSSSYIESGISTNILNSDYTISFWGKSSNGSGGQTFINTNNNAVAFVRIDYSAGGNLSFYHRASSGANDGDSFIVSGMADGNWHHVVITKDNTSVKAYKDGSLVGTITSTSGTYSNNTTLQIGRNNYNANGANNLDGNIDQVRIYDKALSSDEVEILYNETTDTVSDTNVLGEGSGVALYSLDYDASDAGGDHNGTVSGGVTFGVDGQINWGASFDGGSSTHIEIPDSNYFSPATNDFSVSMWVKPTQGHVMSKQGEWHIRTFGGAADGMIEFQLWRNGGVQWHTRAIAQYDTGITDGDWHHLVVTADYLSSYRIYLDGVKIAETTSPSGTMVNTTNPVYIGSNSTNTTERYVGDLDQVRFFKKSLSQSEVDTLYAETACVYTPTTDTLNYQGTNLAYYKLDGNANDETTNYDGVESNITYEFGRFGQAAVFNGSSSYITTGVDSSDINMENTSFSCWINFTATSGTIMDNGGAASSGRGLILETGSGYIVWQQANGTSGQSTAITSASNSYNDGNWHHVVGTIDGNRVMKLYIDGNVESSTSTANSSATSPLYTLEIGRRAYYNSQYFNGKIDQVRIFDSALDATAVENLYNEKQAYITKNASDPFGDDNEVSFYDFESNAGNTSQDATGNNDAYFGSGVSFTSGSGLFGTYAAYMNNNTQGYITFNVLSGITTDYSFSLWAIPHSSNNFPFLTSNTGSTTTNYFRFALHQNGNYYFDFGNTTTGRMTGVTPSEWRDGNWHHFTWVSSATEKFVYVDGSLYNSISSNAGISNQSTVTLGRYLTNYASGYYDQLRVFDRALDGDEVFKLYAEVIN
jgi:hypothetical protein